MRQWTMHQLRHTECSALTHTTKGNNFLFYISEVPFYNILSIHIGAGHNTCMSAPPFPHMTEVTQNVSMSHN